METRPTDRATALRDLLELRKPVAQATAALSLFDWDSDVELVTLSTSDVLNMLTEYLMGTITSDEVEVWAEALARRDDIALQDGHEEELKVVIFELSTPEIHEPITPDLAARWKGRLGH